MSASHSRFADAAAKMTCYRYFDFCVASDLRLPALPECGREPVAWTVTVAATAPGADCFKAFHDWRDPRGTIQMSAARRGGDYALEFPNLVRFVIHLEAGRIEACPEPGCEEDTLAHLLLDQVLPRVVCHGGRMVLHASAVVAPNGRALAFTGPSGRGKSTLAGALLQAGYGPLSDDCLLLERRGDGVVAIPAYSSIRLWPDTFETLFESWEGADVSTPRCTRMAQYTRKQQLLYDGGEPGAGRPEYPLATLVVLSEPATTDQGSSVTLSPVRGTAVIMALIEAQFALDVVQRDSAVRNFEVAGRIAGAVPTWRLSYPRRFDLLPRVRRTLEEALLSESQRDSTRLE